MKKLIICLLLILCMFSVVTPASAMVIDSGYYYEGEECIYYWELHMEIDWNTYLPYYWVETCGC